MSNKNGTIARHRNCADPTADPRPTRLLLFRILAIAACLLIGAGLVYSTTWTALATPGNNNWNNKSLWSNGAAPPNSTSTTPIVIELVGRVINHATNSAACLANHLSASPN